MQRHIMNQLIKWKQRHDRLPLLLRGARQVGKTFIIEQFGREYFQKVLTVNFELNPEYGQCFQSRQPKIILEQLEIMTGQLITTGDTLLFLDEIQNCPLAIESLRYFKEYLPQLAVVGAGSLLEFTLQAESFRMPVGRVEFLFMKPMTFDEFLTASGHETLHRYLNEIELHDTIPDAIHHKALELLRQYCVLGGMPAVVKSYLQQSDWPRCQTLQAAILNAYRNDFGHYASQANQKHCRRLFDRTPHLVAKRFKYVDVDPDTQSRELKKALTLLQWAGIIFPVNLTTASRLPLSSGMSEKDFKLLFLDIGLTYYACRLEPLKLIHDEVLFANRGALTEQFVGQELIAHQANYDHPQLYYWHKKQTQGSAEIDYLTHIGEDLVAIEVKAGSTGRLRSLKIFMEEKKCPIGVKISQDTLSFNGKILSLPLYMISELKRLLTTR